MFKPFQHEREKRGSVISFDKSTVIISVSFSLD